MDAYVYLKQVSPQAFASLLEMVRRDKDLSDADRAHGAIRAVGTVTGEYDGVVFIEAEAFAGIERIVLEGIRGQAGVTLTETYLALVPPMEISGAQGDAGAPLLAVPDAPKRRPPLPYEQLLQLKTETGFSDWVFWDLFHKLPGNPTGPGLQGEALTTGPWHLLVELGADTYADLSRFVNRVRNWQHVVDSLPVGFSVLGP